MKISDTINYAATAQEVFVMLADERFQERKCEATGALRHTVSIAAQGERTIIVCTRDMPSDDLPPFVQNMVGETLAVTETQDWGPPDTDGLRHGSLSVDIAGAPLGLLGNLSLGPNGKGSVETIEGDLKAKVPMIGRKIEEAAAPAIRSAIRVESETAKAWLASGP